jgi:ribosomal protein S18 acetylase RimI-like enzyme
VQREHGDGEGDEGADDRTDAGDDPSGPRHRGSVARPGLLGVGTVEPSPSPLDNAVWWSLAGEHRRFGEFAGSAGRYEPDVSVFAALEDGSDDAWDGLSKLTSAGTSSLFRVEPVTIAAGWTRLGGGVGHQMVLDELVAAESPAAARPLGAGDVGEMLALVELTRPGPFAVRTVELGGYIGVFDGSTLVAMAGQRLAPPGYREISAVCTHPDFRGRGLAAGLTTLVARDILARGERPFLHHAADNHAARRVYETLGFVTRTEVSWTVLARD